MDTVGQDIMIENMKQSTQEVEVKFPEKASVDEFVSALVSHIESKPATDICLDFGRHSFCQLVKQTLCRKGLVI